jgi:hypothetical protein
MMRNSSLGLLAFALVVGTCLAQNQEPPKFYKLDFVVKEVEAAKVLNARTYSIIVSTDTPSHEHSSIRTGSRVPTSTLPGSTQVTYLDVGVNIDAWSVREVQNEVSLTVVADISSVLQESTTSTLPIIRQNKWNSSVVVPIKKPTIIFSSDDATTKRQTQLELSATPIR